MLREMLRLCQPSVDTLLPTVLPRRCQPYCEAGATVLLTVLLTQKNLLLGWRYWLVGAVSEPLRLRVVGGSRWPAY